MSEPTIFLAQAAIAGIAGGGVAVLFGGFQDYMAARVYKKIHDEEKAERAAAAKAWAKRKAQQDAEEARAEAEFENNERWGLLRRYCPDLECHMTAPTIGELKRALALPEAQKVREELLAKDSWAMVAAAHMSPCHVSALQLSLQDLRTRSDEDALPRAHSSYVVEMGFWLEELAVVADAQARANRMDQGLPAAGVSSTKGRF